MAESPGVRRPFLLGVGVTLFTGVAMLVYVWLVSTAALPDSSGPSSGLRRADDTALQALGAAADAAHQWQEDARLVAVSGQWSAVGTETGVGGEWFFQFFSPATQRLALVGVSAGTARLVRESLSPYELIVFSDSTDEWRVDSDQARQIWWERGGRSMVGQRPDADLMMQLSMHGDADKHPVWTVTGVIPGTTSAFTVQVDATDATLVEP